VISSKFDTLDTEDDMAKNDVIVWNGGSGLMLVRPVTDRAEQWIKENVQEDAQWYGPALVVEWRYLEALVDGMRADGLEVV